MLTALIFLIVLAVLIFVHELGHFLFARLNGIRVDAFKIGFGPKVFAWKKGETEYGLNLIPFGGFVKIHGENPDEDSTNGPDSARSFVHKNRFQQAAVLVAGVLFNFLFAGLLYAGVFATGVTATTDGFEQYQSYFHNQRILINYVEPKSPAAHAGLAMGDVITSITNSAGTFDASQVTTGAIAGIQSAVNASQGKIITVGYMRAGETRTATVTPETGLVPGKYAIGIAMSDVVDFRLPLLSAAWEGLHYDGIMIKETTVGLYTFAANIFRGTASFSDVSGPVGIAGIVGDAASMGFRYLVMITALISINLGVINLIPFPALDGGRILFVILEGISRRRISPKFTNIVNAVGFVLLMLLMVAVTYKDIANLIH